MIEYIEPLIEGINDLISNPRMIIMWFISGFLYYFGIYKKKEPLLLVPISTGILLANLPMGELLREGGNGEPDGFLRIFQNIGMNNDVLPLLIFFQEWGHSLILNLFYQIQKHYCLNICSSSRCFSNLLGALLISLTPFFNLGLQASSIGIIGGADGPTTIFISTRMRELGNSLPLYEMSDIVGAIILQIHTNYMALVPHYSTTNYYNSHSKKERKIRMEYSEKNI